MEITEGCLSPFCLCRDDVCGPFLPHAEILEASVHVCDLSQYVANVFDGASLLIRTHMRYCRQAGEEGGGGRTDPDAQSRARR